MPYKSIFDERKAQAKSYYKHHEKEMWDRRIYNWRIKGIKITKEQWEQMYLNQNGCCYICKTFYPKFNRGLHVDHNHVTGAVRKLLCFHCNKFIVPFFEKRQYLIPTLIEYVKS